MSLWKPKYKDSNGNIQDLQLATNCLTDGTHLVKLPTLSDNAKVLTTDLTETGQTLDFSVSTSSGDIYSDNVFGYRQTATPFAQSKVQTKSSVVNIQKTRAFGFVKNQLQERDDFTFNGGTTTFTNGKFTVTYNLANGADVNLAKSVSCKANHKYLLHKNKKSDTGTLTTYFNRTSPWGIITGTNQNGDVIYSYTSDSVITLHSYQSSATTGVAEIEVDVIDLTQWFNNDATILAKTSETWFIPWFLTNFGNKIPSTLNTGEVDFGWAKKIKTTNENLWDEETEIVGGRLRSKNVISVSPNTTYYVETPAYVFIDEVDENGTYVSYLGSVINNTFITPSFCNYIKISIDASYGLTYNYDITINISNNSINGTYFKHEEWLFEMDWSFANSGSPRGINSTCGDEKDFVNGKNRVVVGSYTFTGSESWTQADTNGGDYRYFITIANIKPTGSSTTLGNLICSSLSNITNLENYTQITGIAVHQEEHRVYVYVPSVQSTNDMASYMSGKTIYFELATPIETDMSESEKTFNSYIVNTNGTEQLLDENNEQTTGLLTNFYLENDTKQIFNNLNEINGLISNYSNLSDKYLPLTGGVLSGNLTLNNGIAIQSKNTSGTALNILYTNPNNSIIIGNTSLNGIYTVNGIYPGTTNSYNLGTSSYQWNNIYGKTLYENGTSLANKYLPNYTLSITRSDAEPKWVNFLTVNYSTYTENNATSFKLSAMSSHPNGDSYSFLEDIIIGVTATGATNCVVYKYKQFGAGTIYGESRYYGDIFYTKNTTNKVITFFILCGQYSSIKFTPVIKIGATTLDGVTQQTGTAAYYEAGDRYYADGNKKTYARTGECLPLTGGTLSGALNVNVDTANLINIKRLNNNGGAFIKYFNNNQDTNNWQVGMSADNGFLFNYNSNQTLYVDTAGKVIINNNSAIQYKNTSGTPYNVINYNGSNALVLGDSGLASSGVIISHYTIRPSAAASTIATVGTNDNPWKAVYGNYISGDTFEAASYYNTYGESVDLTNAYVVTDDEDDAYETRYGLRTIKNTTSNGTYTLSLPERTGTIGLEVEIVDLRS